MDINPLENPDEKKMIEHGIFIEIPEDLKDEITIKLQPMVIEEEMRTQKPPFIFKRLVVNYSFLNAGGYGKREYTLRVYVTHADIFLNKVSQLAIWKNKEWVSKSNDLNPLETPNQIWAGYFEVALKFSDPSVALGE